MAGTPDFVVVGHVVQDLTPQGSRLGGAATFASVQAHRLGLSVGTVTQAGENILADPQLSGVQFAGRSSQTTTTFENVYDGADRHQRVLSQAASITDQDVPSEWRKAPVVLIAPVCEEIPPDYCRLFPDALIGIEAQGWLRELDEEKHVRARAWTGKPFWTGSHVLFVSDEDVAGAESQIGRWAEDVPTVVVTRQRNGARVHHEETWQEIAAFPAAEVDPTGAGDVFAAAFLVHYSEAADVGQATRFASAAAAFSVEAQGIDGIANRQQIEERVAAHAELELA